MGSVVWAIKDNWRILTQISVLRAIVKPGCARDAIWYPDAVTLYVVSKGSGEYHVIVANQETKVLKVKRFDYIFVPTGTLHTFINDSDEELEVIAFFTKSDPLPEVSLSVSTSFFYPPITKAAMTEYGER